MPLFSRRMPTRAAIALCALAAPALAVSACGSDNVPGNAVAKVDGEVIKTETFNHWMQIAASSSAPQQGGAAAPKPVVPQPPEFTACVAAKKKSAPKPAKGQ